MVAMNTEHYPVLEGMNQFAINVDNTTEAHISVPDNYESSVVVTLSGNGSLKLTVSIGKNANVKYLSINHSNDSLEIQEKITVNQGATCVASYGELSNGNHTKDTLVNFVGESSSLELKGAIIAFGKLKWTIKALHQAKKSKAFVNCNAIVLNNAKLHLEIAGKIEKGYSGSETHQMSRIMNLGENAKGIVYPMLLIDENDVAASHAASVGQPNEEHIYYLQSRGLTRLESLKLITTGYLMPIVEGIDDASIKESLRDEIMKKVNEQWQ